MRNPYAPPRGRSLLSSFALGAVVLLVGAAATLGGLYAAGVELPFLKKAGPDYTGMVEIPLSGSAIPAYTKITRDHLFDAKKGDFATMYRKPDQIPKGAILDPGQIAGRVLNHDKPVGYLFTEKDFFPKGTPAGVTAGVPAGKRSFVFAADKVLGITSLRQGDHFDILAAVDLEVKRAGGPGAVGGSANLPTPTKRAGVAPVVRNGVIVVAAATQQVPVVGAPLPPTGKLKTKTAHEVTVAVDPDEVGPLAEALAVHATLTCVARSGHASDQPEKEVTGKMPEETVTTIEMIVDGKRQVVHFAGGRPVPPTPLPDAAPAPRPVVATGN